MVSSAKLWLGNWQVENFRKGMWSMDHIHSLLIMEDDLDEDGRDTETTSVEGTTATALLPV